MPEITSEQFSQRIKDGTLSPVNVVYGEDPYIVISLANRVKNTVPGDFPDFNLNEYIAEPTSVDEIISAVETLPMMGGKRCVIVEDIPLSNSAMGNQWLEKLEEYFSNPNPNSVLLFVFSQKPKEGAKNTSGSEKSTDNKGDKKKELIKLITKYGESVNVKRYSAAELAPIICKRVSKLGSSIKLNVAKYLVEIVGDDMALIVNETDKLSAARQGVEITVNDVDTMCAKSLEANMFFINSAIASCDADKAYGILDVLLTTKSENPVMLPAVMGAKYIAMYLMLCAQGQRISAAEVCRMSGKKINEKTLESAARDCQKYSKACLKRCIKILSKADEDLKSSSLSPRFIVERMIAELLEQNRNKKA